MHFPIHTPFDPPPSPSSPSASSLSNAFMFAALLSRPQQVSGTRAPLYTLPTATFTSQAMSDSTKRQGGGRQIDPKRKRTRDPAHDGDEDGGPCSMDVVAPTNRLHIVRLFDLATVDAQLCFHRGLSLVSRAGNRGLLHERLMQSLEGWESELVAVSKETNAVLRELLTLRAREAGTSDGSGDGSGHGTSVVRLLMEHPTMDPYLLSSEVALTEQRNTEYTSVGTFADEVTASSEFYETARRVFLWLQGARSNICGLYGGGSVAMDTAVDNLLSTMQRLVHTVGHATLALVQLHDMTRPF